MYSYIYVLKSEMFYLIQKKKNYQFQTLTNYMERIIFLTGMILLLATDTLTCTYLFKAIFWFALVNSFMELSQRIESEIRLKQFDRCFHLKTCYWTILLIRMIPLFLDSLLIGIASTIVVSCIVEIQMDISLFCAFLYSVMMSFQYVILLYIFSFFAIYFKRIQAVLGLLESYTFFYSGIVITSESYALTIFKIINAVAYGDNSHVNILLVIMCLEILIVWIGTNWITHYVRKH